MLNGSEGASIFSIKGSVSPCRVSYETLKTFVMLRPVKVLQSEQHLGEAIGMPPKIQRVVLG